MQKMNRLLFWGLCLLLSACAAPAGQIPSSSTGASPAVLIQARGEFFSAAGDCAVCHTGLKDQSGADVSLDTAWRSTMMANALRDPYFRATLRDELQKYPALDAAVQDKCAHCHTPMAFTTASIKQQTVKLLDDGFSAESHPLHPLAVDGVSCTACHQIGAEKLGAPASFSGRYVIDSQTPAGKRLIYGPFAVQPMFASQMQGASGFLPQQAAHIAQSALCGACHTLYTPGVDSSGQLTGSEFPEQTPFLEWQNSSYPQSAACQDCHMPTASGAVKIASTGGQPQSPFFQHFFVGGNEYMVKLLAVNGGELKTTASEQQFTATAQRALDQLQNRSAQLNVEGARSGNQIDLKVRVENLAGHKLPTGYPSRRAWLHVRLLDSTGKVVFESGAPQDGGRIAGDDNEADPARFEPHYAVITAPDQVQIYESIMAGADGRLTTSLLAAARYAKDNRLTPKGFDKADAPQVVAVIGEAAQDADFDGGADMVTYQINTPAGSYRAEVELLYQSISAVWMNKFTASGAEIDAFKKYQSAQPNTPVVIQRVEVEVK